MDKFFEYFFQDIGNIFNCFVDFFLSIFNFALRYEMIMEKSGEFNAGAWALVVLVNLILIALIVLAFIGLFKLCKKLFRFGVSPQKYDEFGDCAPL